MNIKSFLYEQHYTLPFLQDFANASKVLKSEKMAFETFFFHMKEMVLQMFD